MTTSAITTESSLTWPAEGSPDTKPDGTPNPWPTADVTVWTTDCGRYRAYRIASTASERVEFGCAIADDRGCFSITPETEGGNRGGGNYPRKYLSLARAMEAIERWHGKRVGIALIESNREEVCEKLGVEGTGGYATKVVAKDDEEVVTEKKKRDGPVKLQEDAGAVVPVEKVPKPVHKPVVADDKPVKTLRNHSTSSARNDWGSKMGSNEAKADAVMAKTPKKMSQIRKDAGISSTVYKHLDKMVVAGHLVKENGGYRLK